MAQVEEETIKGHINQVDYIRQPGINEESSDVIFVRPGYSINSTSLSASSVSKKYNRRRKFIYLFGGFAVSTCCAAVAFAVLWMVVVLKKPAVATVDVLAEPGSFDKFHHELASHSRNKMKDMSCIDALSHRASTRAKYAAIQNFNEQVEKKLTPVCCVDIPKDKCDGILPYVKTFFPNKVVSSLESAQTYLESVKNFMDCDKHAIYVFCAMVYPPCIKDTRQVMPCKTVCEGVLNGCQNVNSSISLDSKLSCDHYPVGEDDEIVCRSTSYAINLDVGEEFEFSSPNYPNEFPENSSVVWSITSPEHSRIQIEITDVNIEKELNQELTLKFGQNPYGSTLYSQRITKDRVVLTHINFASVTFQSKEITNGNSGFTATATVVRAKDTLICETSAKPIQEEDLCDGVYDCVECDGEAECTVCNGVTECFDEAKCRPSCGYHILMATEKASEVLSSPPYSGHYEDCIISFEAPKRFRVRVEFLDHTGLVSGCNFKYGYGQNPFNEDSEYNGVPEISKPIDFPNEQGWIWLASSSPNTTFTIQLSAFLDDLVINVGADETFTLNTTSMSTEVANALERGSITFKAPPGYHFNFSCIEDIFDIRLNNMFVGIGNEPMVNNAYDLYGYFDDVLEFFTDAMWIKMYGKGPYVLGFLVSAVPSVRGERHSVLVDETAMILFPHPKLHSPEDCVENGVVEIDKEMNDVMTTTDIVENGNEEAADDDEAGPNVISHTWIVTSVRHSAIGVKFLYFNSSSTKFNFITIGHGLNPDDSSTILFSEVVTNFKKKVPDDFIVKYSTFWVRHTSFSDATDTMLSVELNGVVNIDDLVCPLKFGVTKEDICDDEYDCPDFSDEANCGDIFECGKRPLYQNRQKRVIGGDEAKLGQYPWYGLMMVGGYSHCGSTLLTNEFAITASHCLIQHTNSVTKLEILFASISNKVFSEKHLVVEVSVLFLFPQDDSLANPLDHDIALVKLKKPIPFTNYVRPACLLINETQFQPGHTCYISGFGRQVIYQLAEKLHGVSMTLYSNEKCMDFQSSMFQITDNIVCAGERDGGHGTCYGDSGGPLVCPDDDNTFYLRGLTSFGYTCANRYRPGGFTRIGRYSEFIDMVMDSVKTHH
ncbi:uncharacterized protein [Antedon mediterranea]|uniref:uncharacterized protein n=1 Tax=Antedon mediterranea TaxID=105859 RepID=UPI003AF612F8